MNTTITSICRSCLIPAAPGSVMISLNTFYESFQISEIITLITGIEVNIIFISYIMKEFIILQLN